MAKKKQSYLPVCLVTGVLLLVLSAAVCIAGCVVPSEKIRTYLHILFMDDMKIVPSTGLDGLVIVEHPEIPVRTSSTPENTQSLPDAAEQTSDPTEEAPALSDTGEIVRPSFGEQYAVLSCPAVSMQVPVFWGSSEQLLASGACQSSGSVVLGETGNVVIDAHVNTFFADLDKIAPGDEIILNTGYGIFTYRATELVTFENTDKTYILPTQEDRLTLYTCKAQVLGASTERIGVLCECVSKQYYTGGGTE